MMNFYDDGSRLVWADELSEKGDPRGELITTQYALERGEIAREESLRLRRRERELLEEVPGLDGLAQEWWWTKGAIEEVAISCEMFLQHRDELFEKAPYLHRLRLRDLPAANATQQLDAVLDSAPRIDGLAFNTPTDPGFFASLSSHWSRIHHLELEGVWFEQVLAKPSLRDLESLAISLYELKWPGPFRQNGMRPRHLLLKSRTPKVTIDLDALAPSDFFVRLDHLELDYYLRPGAVINAAPDTLRRLRKLRLPTGLASAPLPLGAVPTHLVNLEELTLSFLGNEDEVDLSQFLSGEFFPKLRVLRIGPGNLTVANVQALLRSPLAQRLEVLDVTKSRWNLDTQFDWDGLLLT